MGITRDCARALLNSLKRDVSFQATLMLGRQQLFISKQDAAQLPDPIASNTDLLPAPGGFSEIFFELIGAKVIDSMDYSTFEGASILHDLNVPIPDSLKNKYSVVFDGGTLEHVFNFPTAIKNCMDLLQIGGHFISITPTNNYCGHGFYQFSPELFFSMFNERNGFVCKLVALGVEYPDGHPTEWFEVKNPFEIKRRVTLVNSLPSSLFVIAQKTAGSETVSLKPFQSDYEHIWTVYDSIHANKQIQHESKLMHYYRMWTPGFIKRIVRSFVNRRMEQQQEVAGLGTVNPEFFTKIDL